MMAMKLFTNCSQIIYYYYFLTCGISSISVRLTSNRCKKTYRKIVLVRKKFNFTGRISHSYLWVILLLVLEEQFLESVWEKDKRWKYVEEFFKLALNNLFNNKNTINWILFHKQNQSYCFMKKKIHLLQNVIHGKSDSILLPRVGLYHVTCSCKLVQDLQPRNRNGFFKGLNHFTGEWKCNVTYFEESIPVHWLRSHWDLINNN